MKIERKEEGGRERKGGRLRGRREDREEGRGRKR